MKKIHMFSEVLHTINIGCAKKIFNNLERPLFSYEIYGKIISYRSDAIKENDIEFVRKCIAMMQ